jgi:small subunit ribosomal protein S7
MKKKNLHLYNKFVGFITKNGKKPKAKVIFDSALFNVTQKLKIPLNRLLLKIFLKLNSYIEIKTIKIRKKVHFVPFPTTYKRRIYLVIKWIINATLEDKRKLNFSEKLSLEIFNLIKNKSSKSLKIKKNNFAKALINRSNLHFRW